LKGPKAYQPNIQASSLLRDFAERAELIMPNLGMKKRVPVFSALRYETPSNMTTSFSAALSACFIYAGFYPAG